MPCETGLNKLVFFNNIVIDFKYSFLTGSTFNSSYRLFVGYVGSFFSITLKI